ncbi:tetratricopeptide repeat protein [bacterium]|nr:tetratricopeptide repeat protein [bacterium]
MIFLAIALILIIQDLPLPNLTTVEPRVAKKIQELQETVSKTPQSAEAWGKMAMNLHAHDFQEESIAYYQKAALLDPQNFHWTYYAAIAYQEIGSPDAIVLFEQSLKRKPAYAPLHLRYAQSLFAAGRFDEASAQFNEASKLNPKSADAYLGLAQIAHTSNHSKETQSNLFKAIELNPNLAEAHALLAEIYREKNNQEQFQKEMILSLQLPKKVPPEDPELNDFLMEGVSSYWYELRGRTLLQKGDYEGGIHELQLAVNALPDPRIYDTLGIAYQYQKKYREAIEQHRAALALDPKSAGTMNNLASALAELGKINEAISYLNQAIEAQPDFAYSYSHLARLQLHDQNFVDAIHALQMGNQNLPDNSELALQLAWLLATVPEENLRRCNDSLNLADRLCVKKNFQDPECLHVMAAAYACSGDFDRAIETAKKTEQLATTDSLKKRIRMQLNHYSKKQIYYE